MLVLRWVLLGLLRWWWRLLLVVLWLVRVLVLLLLWLLILRLLWSLLSASCYYNYYDHYYNNDQEKYESQRSAGACIASSGLVRDLTLWVGNESLDLVQSPVRVANPHLKPQGARPGAHHREGLRVAGI